ANGRIMRWRPSGALEVVREPSQLANGLTFDGERRLIVCEGATRRLTRTELDGTITVLADRYRGERLNAPNDVVVHSSGAIYFSDPYWGPVFPNPHGPSVFQGERELLFAAVFRLDPDGSTLTPVVHSGEE